MRNSREGALHHQTENETLGMEDAEWCFTVKTEQNRLAVLPEPRHKLPRKGHERERCSAWLYVREQIFWSFC